MRILMSCSGTAVAGQLFQQEERWMACVKRYEIMAAQKTKCHMGQPTKPTQISFNMHTCIVCMYICK